MLLQQQGSKPSAVDLKQVGNTGGDSRQKVHMPPFHIHTAYVDERLTAMPFGMACQSEAVSFMTAQAPTEVSKAKTKQEFWDRL